MSTLTALCNKLEPTDELILLNKHYQKLSDVYDKISELKDLIYDLDELDLTCANNEIKMLAKKGHPLKREDAAKHLEQILTEVSYEINHTIWKSQEIFTFQKLAKTISLYKSL